MNPSQSIFKSLFQLSVGLLLLTFTIGASSCLETRGEQKEVEEKQVLKKQVQNLQATTADVNTRFQDVDDEMRKLGGRIDTVETKLAQSNEKSAKAAAQSEAKAKETDTAYREEFTKLQGEIDQLKTQLAEMQESQKRMAQVAAPAPANPKTAFAAGEEKFEKKSWKEAILDYEKYRKAFPKGKEFSTATYKIGVSFQELGMTDEAKAFYEEVLQKFPKSKDASAAKTRLKSLKKK